VMPCGWEGNRMSGVALAMRHRLQWFIHLRAHGLDSEIRRRRRRSEIMGSGYDASMPISSILVLAKLSNTITN